MYYNNNNNNKIFRFLQIYHNILPLLIAKAKKTELTSSYSNIGRKFTITLLAFVFIYLFIFSLQNTRISHKCRVMKQTRVR